MKKTTSAILVAFSLLVGTASSLTNAQTPTTMTAQERTLEAQLIAHSQAGNIGAVRALMNQKIAQGQSAALAKVAQSIANIAEQLSLTDPQNAASLIQAAVIVASNPSVANADQNVAAAVGSAAARIVKKVQSTSPWAAAQIQTVVATEGSSNLQISYTSPQNQNTPQTDRGTQQTDQGTQQTGQDNQRPVVLPSNPTTPNVPIPVIPGPGPSASPT